ncbi:MAG: siroheme synthase-like protein, partial [Candidatus Azotimanducaceae bacterium]
MSFKLPLVHNFEGMPCLVVGGGKRAARKARWLIKAAAQLTVVAPDIEPEFLQLLDASKGTVLQRKFQKSDLS